MESGAPKPWPAPDPAPRPVRWGIGDFLWIYAAGVVASIVGFTLGYLVTGDDADHISATTLALGAGFQYAAWAVALWSVSRAKGRGSLAADFGVIVRANRAWALLVGVGLQFVLGA